ncbi:LuxR C-terminal-related transcriptional regulator [Priestia endophytica]|uniref:LuxR C-terminal-related transcriptional regulator n=1 Tax=Priestia endophytica TaxID=135735 RepID=UPI002282FE89|nr:LuxR C-terminal-related transcriptional regulator [Priestia endophytica]MCY8235393.1 LuxR C-terminal-related transcriptional regulator [Priestia endophytica]
MDQKEELLIGIENVLCLASDLVKEVDRLERVEEECKFLKEQLFLHQFTEPERKVFTLALDGHSVSEMEKILFKGRSTIKKQRQSIMRKLQVSSMQEAIQKMREICSNMYSENGIFSYESRRDFI